MRTKTTMILAAFLSFFVAIYLAGLAMFQIDTTIMGAPTVTWAVLFFVVGLVILVSLLISQIFGAAEPNMRQCTRMRYRLQHVANRPSE